MGVARYGAGFLSLVPSGANPTPVVLGIIKKATAKNSSKLDLLRGSNKYAEEAAAGPADIDISVDFQQWGSATLAAVLSGSTVATGKKTGVPGESGQVATNAYTVANGGTFFEDLGVFNTVSGLWMSRVASGPAAGQYAVNTATGAYTFAAADSNPLVRVFYSYTEAAVGKTVTLVNQPMGPATQFSLSFFNTYGTRKTGWRYPAVVVPDMSLDFGSEEWAKASQSFKVLADASGNVLTRFEMD